MKRGAILVTGVSRGLGPVICRTLLDSGYTVFGLARGRTQVVEELERSAGDRFRFKEVDLADSSSLEAEVFGSLVPEDAVLHGLVNNAAIAYDDLATNLNLDSLEKQFRVNVYAPMILVKGAIRNFLLHSTAGSMVHLSSLCTKTGYKGLSFYGATKGALEGYSINLAREWGPRGIRSNCVAAGFMETDMTSGLDEDARGRIHRRTSLGKPVDKEKVAETIRFLLSEESGGITGDSVRVDNGSL